MFNVNLKDQILYQINIYNGELDETDIKILTKKLIKEMESRIATRGLYQF